MLPTILTQENENTTDYQAYNTIGRRIIAGLADSTILSVPYILLGFLLRIFYGQNAYAITTVVNPIISVIYSVVLVKIYGGTIGKLQSGIRVVDYQTESSVSWFQSIKRELLTILNAVYQAAFIWTYMSTTQVFIYRDYRNMRTEHPVFSVITFLFSIIGIIEIVTALTNKKRRAIHDFLGGTVVKKTKELKSKTIFIWIILFAISLFLNVKMIGLFT